MQHVFVYGSLLYPDIVTRLTGKTFEIREASLKNYQRRAVKEADYPAVVQNPGSNVAGKLLLNVDDRSLDVLRFFEGDEYKCAAVEVETKNEKYQACVFVWIGSAEKLEETDWNATLFEAASLADSVRYVIPEVVEEFERLFS